VRTASVLLNWLIAFGATPGVENAPDPILKPSRGFRLVGTFLVLLDLAIADINRIIWPRSFVSNLDDLYTILVWESQGLVGVTIVHQVANEMGSLLAVNADLNRAIRATNDLCFGGKSVRKNYRARASGLRTREHIVSRVHNEMSPTKTKQAVFLEGLEPYH